MKVILIFFLGLPFLLLILLNVVNKTTTDKVNRYYIVNTIIVILFTILIIYSIPIVLFHDFSFAGPLKMIMGIGVYKPYYIYIRLFFIGLIIYFLINLKLGEVDWDTVKFWTFIIIIAAIIMGLKYYYFHNIYVPKKEKAKKVAITVIRGIRGEKLVISLKPHQKIVVKNNIKQYQRFQFVSFTGPLMVRVNNGNGIQCWSIVENTLPWWAYRSGKLEVKAGNTPVVFTIIIENK